MVIAHNMMAMNAQRQFNIVGNSKKKSTEKLSSGYRINRAADDAVGLAISEKMRRQKGVLLGVIVFYNFDNYNFDLKSNILLVFSYMLYN